jgi:hypothetical protein
LEILHDPETVGKDMGGIAQLIAEKRAKLYKLSVSRFFGQVLAA